MANEVVYTTETPYSVIANDFFVKFLQTGRYTKRELEIMDLKWRELGKKARNGKFTGMKYI